MNAFTSIRGSIVCLALVGLFVTPVAPVFSAPDDAWLHQLTALVREHQALAEHYGSAQAYEVYVEHLNQVHQTLRRGDAAETYRMMNRFMAMLERRVGGIPAWSADVLFDYCGTVTPPMYHDVSRHLPKA